MPENRHFYCEIPHNFVCWVTCLPIGLVKRPLMYPWGPSTPPLQKRERGGVRGPGMHHPPRKTIPRAKSARPPDARKSCQPFEHCWKAMARAKRHRVNSEVFTKPRWGNLKPFATLMTLMSIFFGSPTNNVNLDLDLRPASPQFLRSVELGLGLSL